jgi:hypothetical protein
MPGGMLVVLPKSFQIPAVNLKTGFRRVPIKLQRDGLLGQGRGKSLESLVTDIAAYDFILYDVDVVNRSAFMQTAAD